MSLRILFATHAPRAGHAAVFRSVSAQAEHLRRDGHEVHVVTRDELGWSGGARLDPLVLPLLLLFRDLASYDVVVFHSYLGWAFHLARGWLRRARRVTTITWFHGLEPLYHTALAAEYARTGRALSWRFRVLHLGVLPLLIRASCRASAGVFCFSSAEAAYVMGHAWARPERVHLIANGVEAACFLERRHRTVARRILFVGQWLPAKGIRYLAEAFAVLASGRDVELACVGTGSSVDDVRAAFPTDVRSRVSVRPRVDRAQLYEELALADVFLFPSLSEGFSCALLEGMAAGLPVVATPVGAGGDFLRDGANAMLVDPADSAAIVRAVAEALTDPGRRQALGEQARRTAARFTADRACEGFSRALYDVAAWRPVASASCADANAIC